MINWDTTREDEKLINIIVKRAVRKYEVDAMDTRMDITATHLNGCPLDLEKLLTFDDFNFAHDIFGIAKHIDRTTGELTHFFLPRCAK